MSLGVPTSAATPVGRFRIVAFWEGISYLVLLLVAMPLKYGLGVDMAVTIVGMAHGVLFLGYCVTLALAAQRLGVRLSMLAFVLSFVPCGTFWLEARLRQDERERARRDPVKARDLSHTHFGQSPSRRLDERVTRVLAAIQASDDLHDRPIASAA